MILLFLGIMAFTVDAGFWLLDRRGGQNQVDASVLAGVQGLPRPPDDLQDAALAAQKWLEANSRTDQGEVHSECGVDEDDGYDVVTDENGVPSESGFAFRDTEGDGLYDTIRACIRRDGLLIFARVFDVVGVQIPAVAAAGVVSNPKPYSLMAMNPDCTGTDGPRSLNVGGNGKVILDGGTDENGNPLGGSSYTRSSCSDALYIDGNSCSKPCLQTSGQGTHDVVGDADGCASNPIEDCISPEPRDDYYWIDDPWASVPVPSFPGGSTCTAPPTIGGQDGTFPLAPGTYCSLSVGGNGNTVTLSEGVYVFKGLVHMGGNNTLTSDGEQVLIYMTCNPSPCDPSRAAASFLTEGQSNLNLTGHDDYEGIAIFVDRGAKRDADNSCTSTPESCVRIAGTGQLIMDGGIYNIASRVEIEGGGSGDVALDGSIIADTIAFKGNAEYTVSASVIVDGEFDTFLVE
jgi:hypothetical protein